MAIIIPTFALLKRELKKIANEKSVIKYSQNHMKMMTQLELTAILTKIQVIMRAISVK